MFKGNFEKPFYVDEPMWLTIDRRADGDDDYFWVTRGRRGNSWKHPAGVKLPLKLPPNYYYNKDEYYNKIK